MNAKTKVVEIEGIRYQFRKLPPDLGSYILMKMLGAGIRNSTQQETSEAPAPDAEKPTGDQMVRAVAFSAFLRGLDFETHAFIQKAALSVCSRLEERDAVEVPVPITVGSGMAIPEIRENIPLVMKLELEALVFNLSDFFDSGGLNELAESPAPGRTN